VFGGLTGTDGVDAAKAIGAALAIGLGAIGPGLGIIGAALAEAVAIYAFVIAVIIAFVI
jgi:F0F1-type ATP synthase membrane subunit c/vacuolar-type H+-ATPase subunit K